MTRQNFTSTSPPPPSKKNKASAASEWIKIKNIGVIYKFIRL